MLNRKALLALSCNECYSSRCFADLRQGQQVSPLAFLTRYFPGKAAQQVSVNPVYLGAGGGKRLESVGAR